MLKKGLNFFVEPVAFAVLFFLTIKRIIWGGGWISIYESTTGNILPECLLWALVGGSFLWISKQKKNLSMVGMAWRRNWILVGFILFAMGSLFWSEYILVSFYRVFVLIACSVIAAYIGITTPSNILIRNLAWFFIIVAGLSYALALFLPGIGTFIGYPYFGTWRGLFISKNYMGSLMAFGSILFLFKTQAVEKSISHRLLSLFPYLLIAGLVFLSRSATAIILFVILNLGSLVVFSWARWKHRLQRGHYIALGFLFAGVLILTLTNLDPIFGLLNKNTTLTGRVPMWSYLIGNGLSKHALLGNGFGATWMSDQFRTATQAAIGWDLEALVSDNGWLDIFLHLGLVGVVLLTLTVLLCVYRTAKHALKERTIISFFPALVMLFFVTANISLSFILELESFAWFLMVFALFSTTPHPPGIQSMGGRENSYHEDQENNQPRKNI